MKFYLASSFDEAALCETVFRLLKTLGHEVPDVWWNVRSKDDFANNTDAEFYGASIVQSIAARHWLTLREVDAVILISNLEKPRSFTGANVEIGFALALGKPVLSVGLLKRSAMYCPVIQCEDFVALGNAIRCIGRATR
jgi:nucleoside 2-deoxyribosyltransferase